MLRKQINYSSKKTVNKELFIKLLAHIVSILVCSFFTLFLFGIGIPDFMKIDIAHITLFNFFLLVPLIGYILTWFNERIGVLLILLGGLGQLAYHSYYGNIDLAFIFGLPFILSASLFYLDIKVHNKIHFDV